MLLHSLWKGLENNAAVLYKVNMQVHVKQSVEVAEVYDVLAASKQYLAKALL